MKFTFSWLKDFLDTNCSIEQIIETLNKIGHEVEEVINQADIYKPFIVAEIISSIPHPQADKLRICQVNDSSKILQIVCGAPNARAGIKVVLAPVGAIIPASGIIIKQAKIREQESCGMLCSGAELLIDNEADGIIELPENYIVGSSFAENYGLNEVLIDLSITPNRGDCLGIYGIARELAAAGLGTLKKLDYQTIKGEFESPIKVNIENKQVCLRYYGRYFKINNNGASPLWLQNRLKSIGEKSISTLVDITNYFTYSFARPLHVFDADKIEGNLVIRDSRDETITALNEKEYRLNGELVIADDKKPVAIAGIIGSTNSAVDLQSKNIFLEMGLFDAIAVAKVARSHQIETDAKFRFERKIDSEFMDAALQLATEMILDLCGGTTSYPVIANHFDFKPAKLNFALTECKKKVGIEYPKPKVLEILNSLGFIVEDKGDILRLTAPSWRHDIAIEEDIVEEIARIEGYDKIEAIRLPEHDTLAVMLKDSQAALYRLQRFPASLGLNETMTWSFMHSKEAAFFSEIQDNLYIKSPISSELDYMRPSILPNLLDAAKRNLYRTVQSVQLYEIGPIFKALDQQLNSLSGLRSGFNHNRNIYGDHRPVDFFDCKADVLAILAELGCSSAQITSANIPGYYHPGRAASVSLGKNILGYFGELHPNIVKYYDLNHVVGFELFLDNFPASKSKYGRKGALQTSDYPMVSRDFAFIFKQDITIETIIKLVMYVDKKLIKSVEIFDIYAGKGIEMDEKSIAFSVTLQAADHTLSEQEIEDVSLKIITAIEQNTKAVLRK